MSFSDHSLVKVRIGADVRNKSRPKWELWKLNTRLLGSDDFQKRVRECFNNMSRNKKFGTFAQWDSFKREVKNEAIEFACIASFHAKKDETAFLRNLNSLYELECEKPGEFQEEIILAKSQLQRYQQNRYNGALVRSRCRRFLSSETPSRRAINDERRHGLSKEVNFSNCNGTF